MNCKNSKLVVTHVVSGDLWAGAESQVYNLCRALATSKEIFVTAIVFNPGILYDKLRELGIPVTLADENKLGPIAICRTIAAHCKVHESKIVHTHGFKENVLGILGKELAQVPFSVRTVHGNPETQFKFTHPQKWLVHKLDVLLGRFRQQAVIAVSSQLEEKLHNMFPGKVYKIFNFIDVESVRHRWAKSPAANDSVPKIGIVGRLVPVKRVDIFIRMIASLNNNHTPCKGVIVGDGPLLQNLMELSDSLKLSEHISFKGFLEPALSEIRNLDILVMPSDHEGLPMTILEALALEINVIAHRTGGIPEILAGGECGWLVNQHCPEGYAREVVKCLESPPKSIKKNENGVAQVTENFDAFKNAKKYEDLYKLISS
jgi:glycosyltransferase involved in cell wall biosynthesis